MRSECRWVSHDDTSLDKSACNILSPAKKTGKNCMIARIFAVSRCYGVECRDTTNQDVLT